MKDKYEKAEFFIHHLKKSLSNHDITTFSEEFSIIDGIIKESHLRKLSCDMCDYKRMYELKRKREEVKEEIHK